jgi:hypothetical protein
MLEPTIMCTKCQTVIPLTETLARPYIEAERKKMDEEILERAAAFEKRENELERRTKELAVLDRKLHENAAEIDLRCRSKEGREAVQGSARTSPHRESAADCQDGGAGESGA